MNKSNNDIHDLAAQYLDLWQKQLFNQSSDRVVQDSLNTFKTLNEQTADLIKSLDSPEKIQAWMTTWAESWKEQFKDGTQPFNPFANIKESGAASPAPASGHTGDNVDELTRRIDALEKRVRELESRLKD